jgi:hypothetical protein
MFVAVDYCCEAKATRHEPGESGRRAADMLWVAMIVGTYVAGIYLMRLVWWQE